MRDLDKALGSHRPMFHSRIEPRNNLRLRTRHGAPLQELGGWDK
jgi:hypothetical protein